ncbi:ATP-binding cassette sub-family G member 1, partial [Dictyocoela roeselum]
MGCVHIFYAEQKIYKREYQEGYYRLAALYFAKIIGDTCVSLVFPLTIVPITYFFTFLGYSFQDFCTIFAALIMLTLVGHSIGILFSTIFENINTTLIVLPACLLPLVTISGFQVDPESLVFFLKCLQYISPTRYGFSVIEDVVLGKKVFVDTK